MQNCLQVTLRTWVMWKFLQSTGIIPHHRFNLHCSQIYGNYINVHITQFIFDNLFIRKLTMFPMQILTMEYVPGIKINKIQALDQLGVDRKRLTESLLIWLTKSLWTCYHFLLCISANLMRRLFWCLCYVLQVREICSWVVLGTNSITWFLPCWPCEFAFLELKSKLFFILYYIISDWLSGELFSKAKMFTTFHYSYDTTLVSIAGAISSMLLVFYDYYSFATMFDVGLVFWHSRFMLLP
jgi:hypothetical protein